MPRTLGDHWVKSGYGLWLPGDDRGHWSEAWDEQIGFVEPHTLHETDPIRHRMAEERMRHPPVRLSQEMIQVVIATLVDCERQSEWSLAALSVEATHLHALLTYTTLDIDRVVKWLAQETTKAVHQHTNHEGPVWCKGKWLQYLFNRRHWNNTVRYVERHNLRKGLPARVC